MEFNTNYNMGSAEIQSRSREAVVSKVFRNVYLWMCGALIVTALSAFYVASHPGVMAMIFGNQLVFWGLFIAEFALVIGLSAAINRISALTATLMFLLYSVINGVTLSSIFLVYEIRSIGTTFLITAGTLGNLCLMALIGLIIASVVNIFLRNTMFDMIVSGIGVLVFVGLTAYDAQTIKALLYDAEESDTTNKIAVLGALSLYLDFVNMFLYLLRFFGRRD
ncbi:MAG: Bax inhibitor-1/YccA family protein [Bacteroidales bacterium]|nr:Bax inhibitor-1/YccA family protein [Bacteroidales bacterium]